MPRTTPALGRQPADDDELDSRPEGDEDELHQPPEEEDDHTDQDEAEIEQRARRAGWIPENEWDDERAKRDGRKKPKTFVSARQWIENMEGDNVALRGRNRYLDKELQTTQAEVRKGAAELTDLRALVEDLLATQKKLGTRAYEKAKRDLEARMDRAVEDANPEDFKAAKEGLKQLDEEREDTKIPDPKPKPKDETSKVDPYTEIWVGQNSWYATDPVARSAAVAIHGQMLTEHPDWTLRENLAEVRAQIADRFPEHFENQRRSEAPRVSRPSGDQGRAGKKVTFNDLSQEQKDTYDRQSRFMKAKGVPYTKEEFLADQLLG